MGVETIVASAFLSTGTAVAGSEEQKRQSRRLERQQTAQARLQERIAAARTKRTQRIRQAQLQGVAGAQGIAGSAVLAPTIAGQTGAQAQLDLTAQQTQLQVEQFGIQQAQTSAAASAQIAQAVGTFASTLASPTPGQDTGTLGGDIIAKFKG